MTRLAIFLARCVAAIVLTLAAPIAAGIALWQGAPPVKAWAIALTLLGAAWIVGPSDESRALWRAACSDD